MQRSSGALIGPALILTMAMLLPASHAEVIEEVVAWVNGDVVTKSDLEFEERGMLADLSSRYSGDELQAHIKRLNEGLVMQLIETKMLVQWAERKYDVSAMRESYYEMFKEQQQIESDEELSRMLAQEGMTVEDWKERLLHQLAPNEMIRFEVSSRIAIGDKEVQEYFESHAEEFATDAEVTVREIVLMARESSDKRGRREEAQGVVDRLLAGEDFAELARELSEAGTSEKGGLLGTLKRGDLAPELEEIAFSLENGEDSGIIERPYGFHILHVDSLVEAGTRPLDEVREQLRDLLWQKKFFEEHRAFMKKLRDDSEWCVKRSYAERVPPEMAQRKCETL